MNIVYVEYDMPGPSRMPFSAAPDKDGHPWIPTPPRANKITRLDWKTGEIKDFTAPYIGTAWIHSAVPGPDGAVWIAQSRAPKKIGRRDPQHPDDHRIPGPVRSKRATEFEAEVRFTPLGLDPSGNVCSSGVPLTKFHPETLKFTHFAEVPALYDVKPDKNGDILVRESNRQQNREAGRKNHEGNAVGTADR